MFKFKVTQTSSRSLLHLSYWGGLKSMYSKDRLGLHSKWGIPTCVILHSVLISEGYYICTFRPSPPPTPINDTDTIWKFVVRIKWDNLSKSERLIEAT